MALKGVFLLFAGIVEECLLFTESCPLRAEKSRRLLVWPNRHSRGLMSRKEKEAKACCSVDQNILKHVGVYTAISSNMREYTYRVVRTIHVLAKLWLSTEPRWA